LQLALQLGRGLENIALRTHMCHGTVMPKQHPSLL
jgi:hypothetical protein